MQTKPTIAILGGTGDLGSGLARLLVAAAYPTMIGSRVKAKAEQAAGKLALQLGIAVRGDDNRAAAQAADIVLLCVPYSNHDTILADIKPVMDGKILVDAVVPLKKLHGGERADCDILVFADDATVREQVIALANVVATRGVDGGVLANAVAAEALTSVLIAINRRYKVPGAGIRITGLPIPEAR
jgi:predicted dinucleotide-binding enzyme